MTDLQNAKVQKILHAKGFAHLATIGPDGAPESSPMWFLWDGEHIKFTHTTNRKKYHNIQRDPRVAVSITDGDDPYIYAVVLWSGSKKTLQALSMIRWQNTMARPRATAAIRA